MGELHAWVDESMRATGVPVPVYLLGAAIARKDVTPFVDRLRRLAPRGGKLHWRDLGERGRAAVAREILTEEIQHVIVIASPLTPGGQERARGRCFERLLWELERRSVQDVVVESRSDRQDRSDLRRVDGLRSRMIVSREMRVEWRPGGEVPMLWVPDDVLGMVGDAYRDEVDIGHRASALITRIYIPV
ncbi:hypothetical protein ACXET9_12745 [Brachybacterium sp. DNPG3]